MRIYPRPRGFGQTPDHDLWTTTRPVSAFCIVTQSLSPSYRRHNDHVDTLISQLDALRSGRTTSKELTEHSLAEIERTQPTLNAFRVVAADDARRAAAEADERRDRGEDAPLLGVPVCIKDDTDLAGHPTAFGCAGEFPPATEDAELVRRLKHAGAVIVGKTHSSELGQWPLTGTGATGYTRNPWARDRTPGGSSGGTAAAVAAGIVAAGLGSDGAGSIRIPAAWTNLVGIKPQRGRLSTYPWREAFHGITVNGPIARTVEDTALLLDVLQGNHDDEVHRPDPVDLEDAAHREPPRLRVGLATKHAFTMFRTELHPGIEEALHDVAVSLARSGHHVERRDPAYGLALLPDFLARSTTGLDDWRLRMPHGTTYDRRTASNFGTGRLARRALRVAKAGERRVGARILEQLRDVDLFLAPTTAQPPLPVEAIDDTGPWGTNRVIVQACPYTWAWNVLGWPAVNVPAGFTDDGLPVGIQIVAPHSAERRLLEVAHAFEQLTRVGDRHPSL